MNRSIESTEIIEASIKAQKERLNDIKNMLKSPFSEDIPALYMATAAEMRELKDEVNELWALLDGVTKVKDDSKRLSLEAKILQKIRSEAADASVFLSKIIQSVDARLSSLEGLALEERKLYIIIKNGDPVRYLTEVPEGLEEREQYLKDYSMEEYMKSGSGLSYDQYAWNTRYCILELEGK